MRRAMFLTATSAILALSAGPLMARGGGEGGGGRGGEGGSTWVALRAAKFMLAAEKAFMLLVQMLKCMSHRIKPLVPVPMPVVGLLRRAIPREGDRNDYFGSGEQSSGWLALSIRQWSLVVLAADQSLVVL